MHLWLSVLQSKNYTPRFRLGINQWPFMSYFFMSRYDRPIVQNDFKLKENESYCSILNRLKIQPASNHWFKSHTCQAYSASLLYLVEWRPWHEILNINFRWRSIKNDVWCCQNCVQYARDHRLGLRKARSDLRRKNGVRCFYDRDIWLNGLCGINLITTDV